MKTPVYRRYHVAGLMAFILMIFILIIITAACGDSGGSVKTLMPINTTTEIIPPVVVIPEEPDPLELSVKYLVFQVGKVYVVKPS